MGEVYRANDSHLKRAVAIKVLPAAVAGDVDRLARFQREAQVLAALNHPNIAGIYGFEEGPAEAGHYVRALVMELVEGEDLSQRIARGPMPLDEALPIAKQIAEALEAAHEQGIIHRDLKPANIKVRPDGTVKVLDFGLARPADASDVDAAHSPTITALSRAGIILGTAAYMSPEQARGRTVDKRADIWAFGCVLFEMLAGVPAFDGETTTDTLAAIVGRAPDWSRLPPDTPASVRTLLGSALEKDPKRRLRDIGDAHLVLHERADAAAARPESRRSTRIWQSVAVLALVTVAALGFDRWRSREPAVGAERPRQLTRLTSDIGLTTEPSVSADGRLLAYASDRAGGGDLDIWVQQTAGGGTIRLTDDPNDDRSPTISPDGTTIVFRSDRGSGGIYVIPALGGDARLIAPDGRAPKFSPDGRSIAYWTGSWLATRSVQNPRRTYVVDVNGGAPTQVATELSAAGDPVWSPDGSMLLVHGRRGTSGAEAEADWWLAPARGGPVRATNAYEVFRAAGLEVNDAAAQPYPAAWTRDGVLLSATRNHDVRAIHRVSLDTATGRVGTPVGITHGTSFDDHPVAAGEIVFFAGESRRRLILGLPLDADAGRALDDVRVLRSDVADVVRATVTSDGTRIAFPRYEAASGSVWVRDLRSGRERQLAATRRTPLNPVISPDGTWVGYTVSDVDQGGNSGAGTGFVLPVEGGTRRQICDDCELQQWVRSNKAIVALRRARSSIVVIDVDTRAEVAILSPASGAATAPSLDMLRPVGGVFSRPLVSHDERFISFVTERQTYVAPFSTSAPIPPSTWQRILSLTGGAGDRTCGWSPDGRLLYFLLQSDGFRCLYAVRVDPRTGRADGEAFSVAHLHNASREWGSTGYSSAVAKGIFVFNQNEFTGNIWMLR